MSFVSIILFDGNLTGDASTAPHVLPASDLGYTPASWYLAVESVVALGPSDTSNPSTSPQVPTEFVDFLAVQTKPRASDPFLDTVTQTSMPSGPVTLGPQFFQVTGPPARVIQVNIQVNDQSFVGKTHAVKVTLYAFKDTGLLAQN